MGARSVYSTLETVLACFTLPGTLTLPTNCRFEVSARKKEKQILDDLKKNGNPCP